MTLSRNRILSGLFAVIYTVIALCIGGSEAGFKIGAFVILPLGLVLRADGWLCRAGLAWSNHKSDASSFCVHRGLAVAALAAYHRSCPCVHKGTARSERRRAVAVAIAAPRGRRR